MRRSLPNAAYTLIELALVIGIVSLLLAGVIAVVEQTQRRNAAAEIKGKMDTIENALLDFRRLNNRLPCPADSTVPETNQYFGVEAISPGDCTNAAAGTAYNKYSDLGSDGGTYKAQAANFFDGVNTVVGDVPVRTLGLPDDAMFDPWGGRFVYAVDNRITATSGPPFITYNVTSTSNGANPIGTITIGDGGGVNTVIPNSTQPNVLAIAVLMSYGPDGHGAFQLSGARKSVENNNTNTKINCHCDNSASAKSSNANPLTEFIQAPATSSSTTDTSGFDDIVRGYTRSSFLNNSDISTAR